MEISYINFRLKGLKSKKNYIYFFSMFSQFSYIWYLHFENTQNIKADLELLARRGLYYKFINLYNPPSKFNILNSFNGILIYSKSYISLHNLSLSELIAYSFMCKQVFVNPIYLNDFEYIDDCYYLYRNNYIFISKYMIYFLQILKQFIYTYINSIQSTMQLYFHFNLYLLKYIIFKQIWL